MYIGENDVNIVRKRTPSVEFSIYAVAFKVRGNGDGAAADARFVRPRGERANGVRERANGVRPFEVRTAPEPTERLGRTEDSC
jgi:hypothetical protein